MSKRTWLHLLLTGMVTLLMSFSTEDKAISALPDSDYYAAIIENASDAFDLTISENFRFATNSVLIYSFDEANDKELKTRLFKGKKKYKRILNNFSEVKSPVRDNPPVSFNIFWKDLYSKPHFLSHIHHFLFRLTPF